MLNHDISPPLCGMPRLDLHTRLTLAAQSKGPPQDASITRLEKVRSQPAASVARLPMELLLEIIDTCQDKSTLARFSAVSRPLRTYVMAQSFEKGWLQAANKEFGPVKANQFATKFKNLKAKEICKLLVLDKRWQALCEERFGFDKTSRCTALYKNTTCDRIYKKLDADANFEKALSAYSVLKASALNSREQYYAVKEPLDSASLEKIKIHNQIMDEQG